MRTVKGLLIVGVVIFTLVVGSVFAFAALKHSTPAEIVAELTGRDVQTVINQRAETGKSFGAIASDAGVLDGFKAEMLNIKKDILAAKVADGTMTQEQADALMEKITTNQAACDGTGTACGENGIGRDAGAGFGLGNGQSMGQGRGLGDGQGASCYGNGQGNGLGNGQCVGHGAVNGQGGSVGAVNGQGGGYGVSGHGGGHGKVLRDGSCR